MDMKDILAQIFKSAGVESPDLQNASPDAINGAMSSFPPSSFDVGVSNTTVPMAGKIEGSDTPTSMAPFPELPDTVKNFQWKNGLEDIKLPEPVQDIQTPPIALVAPPTAVKSVSKPETPADLSAVTSTDNDQAVREAAKAELEKRKGRNALTEAGAGIGDAISASASAFGGNAPGGSMQRLAERHEREMDKDKGEIETKISNDPNSDVSKAYRQMVTQIAPELADQPAFQNMSAKMIGDKLPLIDTMMKAQAQKDSKEMGLKQIAAQKEATRATHDDQVQGKYEKEGRDVILKQLSNRSGGLGLQDSKVNQAIDLRQMINQNYDPKTGTYNIPPALHSELVLGLARLISPNGQIGIQMEQELKTKTAKEGLAKAFTYLTGVPMSGAPQDVIKMFVHSIDRQGETAEQLRDKYNEQLRQLMPTQLNDDVKNKLVQQEMGSRFTDYKSPKKLKSKSGQTSNKNNPLGLDL